MDERKMGKVESEYRKTLSPKEKKHFDALPEDFKRETEKHYQWEQSPEGIHYATAISSACVDREDDEEGAIIEVLTKIPREIRKDVMEDVVFVVANCSFVETTPSKKVMIVLNFEGVKGADRRTTIAHEIAHYWLLRDSKYSFGCDAREGANQEKAADDLCQSWGFGRAYQDYEQFKI